MKPQNSLESTKFKLHRYTTHALFQQDWENHVEWAEKTGILAAGQTCQAIFRPTLALTERTFDSSGRKLPHLRRLVAYVAACRWLLHWAIRHTVNCRVMYCKNVEQTRRDQNANTYTCTQINNTLYCSPLLWKRTESVAIQTNQVKIQYIQRMYLWWRLCTFYLLACQVELP